MAGLTPYQFGNFSGGLNLADKSDVVKDSEAIDLLNVSFSKVGAVSQREGYVEFTGTALTNRVDSLSTYYTTAGTRQLLAGCGTRLEAIDTSGGIVASATGLAGGPYSFARFAAPGAETAYAANGTDTLRKWNGTAWSAPTATVNGVAAQPMPEAGTICTMANSSRLVATGYGTNTAGGPGGAAASSNPSRANFSNAGDPEAWTVGVGGFFVDFHPGDGEQIMGACTWRNFTFVFKESKFFVVTGERLDAQNLPVFDWYAVDTGVGLGAKQAVCVSRDGVYFMGRQGVYFTNGSQPSLVSGAIAPIWTGDVEPYFQSGVLNHAQIALSRMAWHDERVYVSIPTGTATACDRVLVYDVVHGWWSLYDLPASALVSWRQGNLSELHFGYSSAGNEVGRLTLSATDDKGTAITSRWRSGWFDYGAPLEKTVRRTEIWGVGELEVQFSTDWQVAATSTATVELGDDGSSDVWTTSPSDVWTTSPTDVWTGAGQISRAVANRSPRGTTFSTEFRSTPSTTAWSVHRVARHLRKFRPPGQHGGND